MIAVSFRVLSWKMVYFKTPFLKVQLNRLALPEHIDVTETQESQNSHHISSLQVTLKPRSKVIKDKRMHVS